MTDPKNTTPNQPVRNRNAITEEQNLLNDTDEEDPVINDTVRALKFANAEYEESDEEGFEGSDDEFTGTVVVQHWIPQIEPGSNNVKMGAVLITPTRKFMDKLLTHILLVRKDSAQGNDKKELIQFMGKNFVPRVVSQSVDGKLMEMANPSGDTFPLKGVMFNFKKMNRQNVEELVHGKVVRAMDDWKGNWNMSEDSKPKINAGDKEYKVITKLSHALGEEDIYWYIQHTFKGNWKKLFTATETIYQIWDEGKVPVKTFKRKGINKNLLKKEDEDAYDALPSPEKKQRTT